MNKSDEISTRNHDSKWINQHTYDVRRAGSSGVTYDVRCVGAASSIYDVRWLRHVGEAFCSSGVTYDVRCVGTTLSIYDMGHIGASGAIYSVNVSK